MELLREKEVSDVELQEAWELIRERNERAKAERERDEKAKEEREKRAYELELKRLEVSKIEAERSGRPGSGVRLAERVKIKDLMQPYKLGEDIGLFLVNFERSCERAGFAREDWPQYLLTLLPCEAADAVARLSGEEAESYESSKAALLKKYRLSTEAFRQRFRTATKKGTESFPDFAYTLKANLVEWLKSSDVYGDHDKVIECLAVEQFLRGIPETVRFWVQDRDPEMNLRKVADLAEEYSMRRGLDKDKSGQTRSWRDGQKEFRSLKEDSGKGFLRRGNMRDVPDDRESQKEGGAVGKEKREMPGNNARAFEAKRPVRCFRCQKQGHIVANCPEKVVFSYVAEGADNSALLAPYTKEMLVNGQACTVLRDSAATMDVVHPSYVESGDYTGECAWIRQVVEEHSVCLPIAKICIKGPFGELITEAAVSKNLPQHYPYLFSNKSELLLREQGKTFAEETVMALTRSQARKLSSRLRYEPNEEEGRSAAREELVDGKPAGAANQEDLRSEDAARSSPPDQQQIPEDHEEGQGFISPLSPSLDTLRVLDRPTLIAEQKSDATLKALPDGYQEGVAHQNISFYTKSGLLCRKYRDRKGRDFDQLVIPLRFREDLLRLAHGNCWSGHLGIRKTKARLMQEYYWPGCWKDVEEFVRSCDVCQRVGKSSDKHKAPMRLVPIITEPFRRLVIDIVGPLPVTQSGYRYILTAVCPATKFPEAIPLKEVNSTNVVDALLSIFSRVGFPLEIQCDNGSVFTSALTTTFLEKCGIKLIHSSICHPQSNSVERMHGALKRVLRALCFEHQTDWEACIPATMFALRSAPHESTGFSPAELVYGRTLRSPLRLLRESLEDNGEDPTVVQDLDPTLAYVSRQEMITGPSPKKARHSSSQRSSVGLLPS
ncbi:uncharacterized protein ISCGN_019278 [Ixodes scapularis]